MMGFGRVLDRTGNTGKRSLVKYYLNSVDRLVQRSVVIDIAFDKIKIAFDLFEILSKAGCQVIDDDDTRTLLD